MKPLSEEEQKVLDNAPAGAEFYVTLCQLPYGYYARKKVKYGMSAEYIGINGSFSCSVFDCRISSTIKLADLRARKEQSEKKTVRDKVNKYRAFYPFALSGQMFMGNGREKISGYEFNQCMKEDTGPTAEFDAWSLELKFDRARAEYKHPELDVVQYIVADKTEWVNGLPPLNTQCEMLIDGRDKWVKGELIAARNCSYWISLNGLGQPKTYSITSVKFRKIETPEQKKLRERELKISAMVEIAKKGKGRFISIADKIIIDILVDAGYKLLGEL